MVRVDRQPISCCSPLPAPPAPAPGIRQGQGPASRSPSWRSTDHCPRPAGACRTADRSPDAAAFADRRRARRAGRTAALPAGARRRRGHRQARKAQRRGWRYPPVRGQRQAQPPRTSRPARRGRRQPRQRRLGRASSKAGGSTAAASSGNSGRSMSARPINIAGSTALSSIRQATMPRCASTTRARATAFSSGRGSASRPLSRTAGRESATSTRPRHTARPRSTARRTPPPRGGVDREAQPFLEPRSRPPPRPSSPSPSAAISARSSSR